MINADCADRPKRFSAASGKRCNDVAMIRVCYVLLPIAITRQQTLVVGNSLGRPKDTNFPFGLHGGHRDESPDVVMNVRDEVVRSPSPAYKRLLGEHNRGIHYQGTGT
jgi:hypothetical protein